LQAAKLVAQDRVSSFYVHFFVSACHAVCMLSFIVASDWLLSCFAERWQSPYGGSTVGLTVLSQRGLFTQDWWRWVGVGALLGFCVLFNILILLAQTYLNREPTNGSTPPFHMSLLALKLAGAAIHDVSFLI